MKSIIVMILTIIVINGQTAPKVYNPLAVGNRWEFAENSYIYIFTIKIEKDTIANGKRYFYREGLGERFWERYDTLQMKTYALDTEDFNFNGNTNEEILLDDFSKVPNQFYSFRMQRKSRYYPNGYPLLVRSQLTTYVLGKEIESFYLSGILIDFVFSEGFGMTSYWGDGPIINLQGAIINGKKYGRLVPNETEVTLPSLFTLKNYPNPFNPSTTIEYTIPEAGDVKLTIYDMLGREVIKLLDEWQAGGTYKKEFNINQLQMVSSGIYLSVLETGRKKITNKLVLIK